MSRRPRKVLHVLNSAGGGAALSAMGLAEELARHGVGSCAVCNDEGTPAERRQLTETMSGEVAFTRLYWWNRKTRLPLWKRPLIEARQIWSTGWAHASATQVAAQAVKWQADLLHTNTILTPEGGLAARRLGLPHVWHLRELVGPDKPFRLAREGASFGRYMAKHCSKLVANSEITAELVRDWLPPGLLEVVYNGIDLARFTPRTSPRTEGRIVVAMVGSPTSVWKKHALFVEAATQVDRALPIEWRIYGHDPSHGGTTPGHAYTDALHARIAAAGIADHFKWPGFVADPVEIMSQIDVLVHPADHESFGRVAVEAMAAGLPVIGVRGGGVAEIVLSGTTGILCERDNPREMAAAIEQLVRDSRQRQAFGTTGRARAESHFSLAASAAGILRVYESAMDRPLTNQRAASAPDAATVA